MLLTNSFKEYYSQRSVGAGGDSNVGAFNKAMDVETNEMEAVKAFNNADGVILTVGAGRKVKFIHGMKDLGNTIIRPRSKICGHIGLNESAFVGIIDHVDALTIVRFDTPTKTQFDECITLGALGSLRSSDITNGWSYEGTKVFFPAPFVQGAMIRSGTHCPLELTFVARDAYTEFVDALPDDDGLIDEIDIHIEILQNFLWGIHQGLVDGTNFDPCPDDIESTEFSKEYHSKRITNQVGIPNAPMGFLGGAGIGGNPQLGVGVGHHGNLEILTATLTRVVEEQGASAEILEKMHQHSVEKELEKKEKAEKWHQATKRVVLFAASKDNTMPEANIPDSFRAIINSLTIGNADNELAAQMRELGHEEVTWYPSFTNALRNGNFLFDTMGSPSNLSIFMLRLKDPTELNEQQSKGMKLHILEQGKDNNKSILEIVEANKNVISIPSSVEDLLIVINAFGGVASILFGTKSSLTLALRQLSRDMGLNKLHLKGKVKTDPSLIARMMFAVDNRVQLWLSYLRNAQDREDVNDEVLNCSSILNEIILDQFHLVLPPTFAMSRNKADEEDVQPTKRIKKDKDKDDKSRDKGKDGNDRRDVNKHPPAEFRILEGEIYKTTFGVNNQQHRVKWDEDNTMCPRWWTHGICYKDCRNKASHVPTNQLPADKKSAFAEFLEAARRG